MQLYQNPLEQERFDRLLNYFKSLIEIEKLPNFTNKKLLDLGTGSGFGLKLAKSLAANAIGVEIDLKQIKKAIERNISSKEIIHADASTLTKKFQPETFDIITAFLAPIYNQQFIPALTESIKLLKKLGCLIITVPTIIETQILESLLLENQLNFASEWHPEFNFDKYIFVCRK